MWIPDWLYERLPLLYGAAGVASFFVLGFEGPGAITSPALVAAALRTHSWRRNHRAAKLTRRRRSAR
jgi:hypothetical protein